MFQACPFPRPTLTLFTLLAAIGFLGISCSDWGSDVPECICLAPLNVTVCLEGSEVSELLSLQVSLEEVRLLRSDESSNGVDGYNFVEAPGPIDFLGLNQRVQGLETAFFGSGVFDRVRVTLIDEAPVARDLAGASVQVSLPAQRVFTLPLPTPIVTQGDRTISRSVILQLDVAASLTQASTGPGLDFDPVLRVRSLGGTEAIPLTAVWGRAVDRFIAEEITVLSGADPLHSHTGFNVDVAFAPTARFFDERVGQFGELADRAEFLARLAGPVKLVSVHGDLVAAQDSSFGPRMRATSVRIVGEEDTPAEDQPAVVEGRVVGTEGSGAVRLRITEFRGNDAFGRFQSMQADPETLAFLPRMNALILDEEGSTVSAADLTAGARLQVRLDAPFTAGGALETSSIVRLQSPKHRGTLMLDAGQLALFLLDGEAAIESGAVQSAVTPVRLQLSGDAPVLDVVGRPALALGDVLPPLGSVASGTLTGDPSDPLLENASIVVKPGRLEGTVSGVDAVAETFDASIETIHEPFGGMTSSPPFQFLLAPGCIFEGQATSRAGFFSLFTSLQPGQSLSVEVAGIGTSQANEVIAHEVRAEVN